MQWVFDSGDEMEVRIQNTTGAGTCSLHRATISVALDTVTKVESWYRFARQLSIAAATAGIQVEQRVMMDLSLFGNPTAWLEAHGWDTGVDTTVGVNSAGPSDTAGGGASVASVSLPASRGRVRSAGNPAITNNDRYVMDYTGGAAVGTSRLTQFMIVIQNQ